MIVNHEILQLVSQIYHLNNKIIEKYNDLPGIARQYFIKSTLIEEIIKTNEIEGIHSTKKELKEVYEDVINKNLKKKKSRFYGLVNKYNSLINNEYLKLTTCDSIRKLYDEIMLVDVINESSDNQPDGEIFRKEAVEVISEYDGAIHKGIMPEIEIINYMNEGLKILNDPEATQEQVDNAKEVLTKAMAGLEASNPVKAGDTTASVATGDNGLIGIYASLSVLAVAGLGLLRKKEN